MKYPITLAALSAALALGSRVHAAELPLPKDGWASWQIETVEGAPAWCCFEWNGRDAHSSSCHLDTNNGGYGSHDHETTDAARVYAHFTGGKVDRLRTLAASCPVESQTPIQQLDVATDDSARWFISQASRDDLGDDRLAGLAMHRGDVAFDALAGLARGDSHTETRKHAIFWLAQMRGVPGAKIATDTMFNDADADIRKHASFAVSMSKSPTVAADLTRLGNTDADDGVRGQAWFWLAHTGAPNAEQAIMAALKKDPSDHVQNEATLALSQLPEGRGAHALITMVEDRSLSREQRKRAMFWLAQSKSTDAWTYLDKVLAGNGQR